jgi:TrpR-related protein YerC/YecD
MWLDNRNNEEIDQLFKAILSLKDKEECYVFFGDLCTVNEVKAMSQRLEVAKMLLEGTTYLDITDETKQGSAAISRIKNCLHHGNGGFKLVLQRLVGSDPENEL